MGVDYYAVDENEKKKIRPPDLYQSKSPGVFHPNNPFPGMVIMKNCQGYCYEIFNDFKDFHDDDEYQDITENVYKEYKDIFISVNWDKREGIAFDKKNRRNEIP